MNTFYTSLGFVLLAGAIGGVLFVFTVLRKNTFWAPRGITPAAMVAALRGRTMRFWQHRRVIGLIIGGILLVVFIGSVLHSGISLPSGHLSSPSIVTIGSNVVTLWFWLLIMAAVLYLLLGFVPDTGLAIRIRRVLLVTAAFLIIAALCSWWSSKPSTVERQTIRETPSTPNCDAASFREVRYCWIDTDWSNWLKWDDGILSNGMHVCFDHALFEQIERDGNSYIRFKSAAGLREKIKYRLYGPPEYPDYVCPPEYG